MLVVLMRLNPAAPPAAALHDFVELVTAARFGPAQGAAVVRMATYQQFGGPHRVGQRKAAVA